MKTMRVMIRITVSMRMRTTLDSYAIENDVEITFYILSSSG